ncbi:MAG: uroporphyrinogen decarboxylase family protein [Oscillospiraceae bacterium]|nr:uroporphyrinogen decarboxylase family protein [Oscillospiraceae bacterium]
MNSKERWLAALNLAAADHIPFWPKLDSAIERHNKIHGNGMSIPQMHEYIGSDRHEGMGACFRESRKNTSAKITEEGTGRLTEYITPAGTLTSIARYDNESVSWHPVKMPIGSVEDIKTMTRWYRDCEVELDFEAKKISGEIVKKSDGGAVFAASIGESPLMYFVEWLAGIENAHYFLADYPGETEELFFEMHRVLLKKAEVAAEHCPADLIYMTENTSTRLISPAQYEKYCFGHLWDYGAAFERYGRNMVLHMCGHLKALLPQLAKTKARAFEAFTAPPLGDCTLRDGRAACPDKCLIGGTYAMLWLEDAGTIIKFLENEFLKLPHLRGVVVTSGGVMPPMAEIDKIKKVADWLKSVKA